MDDPQAEANHLVLGMNHIQRKEARGKTKGKPLNMGLTKCTLTHGEVVLLVCGNSGQIEREDNKFPLTLSNIGEASMH